MTILFAGGEDISFNLVGSIPTNVFTTSGIFRSSFSRGALTVGNSTTVADPPANRLQTPTFTAASNIWIHGQVYIGNGGNNNTTTNEQAVLVRSPDGDVRVILRQTGTAGQLKLTTRDAAGTLTDVGATTASGAITTGLHQFDWNINFGSGCTLYFDGTQILTYSGSLETDSATQLNQVDFASLNNAIDNTAASNWSEVIVADADTRGLSLWTLPPQAAGNTQAWTPNTVGDVNKTLINDTTFVSSSNVGDISEWTTPTSAPSGVWNVLAIVQEARVRVGASGPQHFDWIARTAATDYLFGASNAPGSSFGNFNNAIWATNPNTSAAWQITDIGSGFNLGVKSLT
jgi:hypothetical protein